jgi:exosortase F-associated protein
MKRIVSYAVGSLSVAGLVIVFLFQRTDIAASLSIENATGKFILNRTIRFLLNDIFAIGLIYALFKERKYLIFALYVQAAGIIFLLIPYFIVKFFLPHYNGPLISFLHRLILNPTLLMLIIPAFYYQRFQETKPKS